MMRNFLWVVVNLGQRHRLAAVLLCVLLSTFTCARCATIRNRLSYNVSGSPYEITEDIFVDRSGEMVIEPGVEMRFAPGVGILVKGILKAQGTSEKQITLTALSPPEGDERDSHQGLAVHRESSVEWPPLRLVDGQTILTGRLQLLYRDRWWSVCSSSKNWTENDAKVTCRQLGFSDGALSGWIPRHNDSRQFMYSGPGCSGLEISLDQCSGWGDRQLGSGVCDYHMDVEITCMPTLQAQAHHHWKGIEFDGAVTVEIKEHRGLLKRLVSFSALEHVVLSYGGRQRDGSATAAIQVSGVPPVMQSVEVRWSAYHGINVTKHDHPFEIKDSLFVENRGYGIFINSSTGQVSLSSVISRDNGADGVVYAYHESVTQNRLSLCESSVSDNVAYPLGFFYVLDENNAKTPCKRTIASTDPSLTVTIHFKNMLRDDGPRSLTGGTVTVWSGDISDPTRKLAHFVISNTTRPQSVSSTSLTVLFQPPDIPYYLIGSPDYYPVRLEFTMQAVLAATKAYDINMTECHVDGNNGRGIWVQDMITGVNIYDSSILNNTHVAGIHVDGGVGDVTINATNVRENSGDGINVTYAGGYRHIHKTIIEGNTRRGVAFWLNETSDRIPFNFTTHVSHSVIQMNGNVGVLLGNVCRADAFWNISMNSFRHSGDVGIEYLSCWKKTEGSVDTLLILNNVFNTSAKLSVRVMPCLNVKALIANNAFLRHRSGVLRFENIHRGEFLDDYKETFADVDIMENHFSENSGIFVAKLGLVQGSTVQILRFHHNRLVKNIIRQPFSRLKPRSRVAAVVVVTSNNTVVQRNEFTNPDSSYELGSHLEDSSKIIDASLNYWNTDKITDTTAETALHIYSRIFDRKDRYNLAPVEFLQYLVIRSDLYTTDQISSNLERDKTMRFRKPGSYEIGGEVMGDVTLEAGEYLVKTDIFVRPASQLVVKPGSKLKFEQSIGMMVQGRLDSDGTSAEITYTLAESFEESPVLEPGSLRLSGGHEGVVQVTVNGTTGGVCAYGFTEEDAALVCQELGMVLSPRDWLLEASSREASSGATSRVVLSNVQCDDMDTDFLKCKHEVLGEGFENSCNVEVGIRCTRASWSGIRVGILADSSVIRKTVIEKAGLLDFATHTFKAALQLDFNNHILEDLTVRDNVESGIGLMWNDIFKDVRNQALKSSRITGNRNHGIITRSQGVDIEGNTIFSNDASGIYYDPLFTKKEHREMIQSIEGVATAISGTKIIRISADERRYIRVASDRLNEVHEFQVICEERRTIGVMVVDPFKEGSTETLIIRRGNELDDTSAPLWDVGQNLTSFPLRETGFIISLRYKSGHSPKGGVLLMVTAVQPLGVHREICFGACTTPAQVQWLQYKPSIRIERNIITNCEMGIGSSHYNRDVSEHNRAFYYHRYSNETVLIVNNTITENRQEAVFVASPLWDPLTSSVAEITYNLTGNAIENNGGGIKHFSRDLRISNNLFHWVINASQFVRNKGGVDLRLPYVWQYDENYTHSIVLCNNSFHGNTFFVLHMDGHFARFNATGNEVRNNVSPPGKGLFTVGGMEKEMLIVNNEFTDNHAKYIVEFDLESHSERFSVVDANFYRNILRNNFAVEKRGRSRSPEVAQYEPSSYALSVRGVQSINITQNYLTNPDMQFEFLAGVRTSSLHNSINVGYNWWGTKHIQAIRSRIFDFDDWNGYATAEFSPYLAREEYDGATLSDDGSDGTRHDIDLSQPLGGCISTSITLTPRSTPYIVKSDLTVLPNALVTILAGVEMQFYPSVGILVLGDLVAMGRHSDPIKMGPLKGTTSGRTTRSVPSVRKVRLCTSSLCRDGPRRDGFLELYNSSTLQWVPICDQRFTERNAEVVCRELGYGTLDVHLDRGPRHDYGATELARIQSWPQPLECVGQENEISSCEPRLNGYGEHNYVCSHMREQFVYIHCGSKERDDGNDFWGGIRFSVPSYQARHRNDASHNSRRYVPPMSSIRHVEIRGAGVLHNEKSAAIQVVLRHVTLEHINISDCASHGIQVLASPGYQYIHAANVTRNLGTGISFLTLNGQTSAEDRLNYVPLGAVDLPYDIFGFVDICDNNKEFLVDGRILLYYKYDNRPVDCVKIFTSNSYVEKVGFRILQFNLFNATEFTPQPDTISIYDGDIFNYTVSKIGDIRVGHEEDISQKRFYRSQGITLSVKLHASGASSSNGFIAEVVTLPLRTVTARDSKHNVTASYFAENRQGALVYSSAGEITPILTLHSNRFESNGSPLFGNFTSSEGAAVFDIQNSMEMHVLRNLFLRNQGGLRLRVNSANSVSALQGEIKNNVFTQNKNRESLCIVGGSSGSLQRVHAFKNYFVREDGGFRDNILLDRVAFNFSENLVAECKGRHQITVTGFDGVQSSTQLIFRNWFWDNDAAVEERKATVLARSPGQRFHWNYLYNRINYFEMITANDSQRLENLKLQVKAENNWWGSNELPAVSGRIYDGYDQYELLHVNFDPFLLSNDTVLSGNCVGGWEMIQDTCFRYIPGAMTYAEAKHFCQLDNSSIPYVKQKHAMLIEYVTKEQEDFDWEFERLWVQSIDIPLDECAVLYRGSVYRHDCNDHLTFLCERAQQIIIRTDYWYQEPVSIAAFSLIAAVLLCICVCLAFWCCKSRERHKEHLQRQNSIRASMRSASSRSLDHQSLFTELGYKRRIERAIKEASSRAPQLTSTSKHNGSADSVSKQYSYDPDDSQSYEIHEVRNPAIDYSSELEDKYAAVTARSDADVPVKSRPLDLTYENEGYIDRSMSAAGYDDSPETSRDWSSGTDSTLDMKRTLEMAQPEPMDPTDNTFRSSQTLPSSRNLYVNTDNFFKKPLETAM
ncbi:protein bark beetle-like [Ornithodoros turicata]